MRKLALFIGLLTLASPSLAANWVLIGEGNNGDEYYADADSIRHVGNNVAIWRKVKYDKIDKFGDIESKALVYFDCSARTSAVKSWITYDSKGNVSGNNASSDYSMKWSPVAPETVGEKYFTLACPD